MMPSPRSAVRGAGGSSGKSRVEVATLARAGVALVVFAAGSVVAANAGSGLFMYVPYATVGTILVIKLSGNRIGWLLISIAWVFALGFLPIHTSAEALRTLSAPPIELAVVWVKHSFSLPLTFTLIAALAIVFPRGRLPVGGWRRPAQALLLAMGAVTLSAAIWPVLQVQVTQGVDRMIRMPNPLRVIPVASLDDVPDVLGVPLVLIFALLIASILTMLARYVRSTGVERLQLRWLLAGLASVTISVPAGFLLFAMFESAIGGLAWLPALVSFNVPPVAIGIAVLRYRLFEIDRLISRTIGWAVVTGMLLAVFGGAVIGLQALLSGVTQGETLAIAASTLVAFALFQPLRRRVQSAVNRRFDRARVDADRTATAFANRLRDQIDLGGLETDIAATVEGALRPSSTGVWIRGASR